MKYYYLRSGDFRVEEVTPSEMTRVLGPYVSKHRALEVLEQNDNLFRSKELAEEASSAVRSFLATFAITRSEPAMSAPQTQKPSHNTVQLSLTIGIQIPGMEIQSRCDAQPGPNA